MAEEYRRDRKSNISTSRKKQTDAQLFVVGTTRGPTLKCQNLTLGQRGERTQTDNALRTLMAVVFFSAKLCNQSFLNENSCSGDESCAKVLFKHPSTTFVHRKI